MIKSVRPVLLYLLLPIGGCAASPADLSIIGVGIWDHGEHQIGEPWPSGYSHFAEDDVQYIELSIKMSSTDKFESEFWGWNTWTEARFCDSTDGSEIVFSEPSFGSELSSYYLEMDDAGTLEEEYYQVVKDQQTRSVTWSGAGQQPSVFLPIWNHQIRISEQVALEMGGLTWKITDYDILKEPRDICLRLVSATGIVPVQHRTEELHIDGEIIASVIEQLPATIDAP